MGLTTGGTGLGIIILLSFLFSEFCLYFTSARLPTFTISILKTNFPLLKQKKKNRTPLKDILFVQRAAHPLCCSDLHFRGLSQQRDLRYDNHVRCTDLHFRGLSQHLRLDILSSSRCTDLHFRGLSQQCAHRFAARTVARTSISEAFHNLYASFPPVHPLFTGVS